MELKCKHCGRNYHVLSTVQFGDDWEEYSRCIHCGKYNSVNPEVNRNFDKYGILSLLMIFLAGVSMMVWLAFISMK